MDNLHDGIFSDSELKADYELLGIDDYIQNQPTAYDVDAVIKELKKAKKIQDNIFLGTRDKALQYKAYGQSNAYGVAIEIVKRGEINE
jgi:hypothetical protein